MNLTLFQVLMSQIREEIKRRLYNNKESLKTGNLNNEEIDLFLELGDTYLSLSIDYSEYYKAAALYQYVKKALENKIADNQISSDDKRMKKVEEKIENTEKKGCLFYILLAHVEIS